MAISILIVPPLDLVQPNGLSDDRSAWRDTMSNEAGSKNPGAKPVPAALLLAQSVAPLSVDGFFDAASQTWSDRAFACAGAKKHNEAM